MLAGCLLWSGKQDQGGIMLPFRDQKIVGGKECHVTQNMCLHLLTFGVNSMEGYYSFNRWHSNEIWQLSGIRKSLFCDRQ